MGERHIWDRQRDSRSVRGSEKNKTKQETHSSCSQYWCPCGIQNRGQGVSKIECPLETFIFLTLVRLWKVEVCGCLAIRPVGLLPQLSLPNNDPLVPTLCPSYFGQVHHLIHFLGFQFCGVCPGSEGQAMESPLQAAQTSHLPAPLTDHYCNFSTLGFPVFEWYTWHFLKAHSANGAEVVSAGVKSTGFRTRRLDSASRSAI